MALVLVYRGHHIARDSAIVPFYFGGSLDLEPGRAFEIPAGGLVLGRGADAGLRVASNGVARAHARLRWTDASELEVEDLGSTNGTQVNGSGVRRQLLRAGDVLTLAGVFDFEVVDAR